MKVPALKTRTGNNINPPQFAGIPGVSGGEASGGGAELPLPPMSSFRAAATAAPTHSPTDPMLLGKTTLQAVS